MYKPFASLSPNNGYISSRISNIIPESFSSSKATLLSAIKSFYSTTRLPIVLTTIPAATKLDNILYWVLDSLEKKKTKESQHQTKIRDRYKLLAEQMAKEIAKNKNGN